MKETKPCEECGGSITRGPTWTPSRWAKTRYCGRSCSGRANAHGPRGPQQARKPAEPEPTDGPPQIWTPSRADWEEFAECMAYPTDFFYPDGPGPSPTTAAAKEVCRGCRLRVACRELAIIRVEYGIWGATTEEERAEIRRRRRARVA
jgi:WhiB family redox-sensing transcriptional regulator